MISFGESTDNIVHNCFSNRQQNAGIVSSETITGIAEVVNSDFTQITNRNNSQIFLSNSLDQ